MRNRVLTVAYVVLGAVATSASTPPGDYRDEIRKYRAGREAELKADDGWLTVVGLFWLKPGANVTGSAAGSAIQLPGKAPPHHWAWFRVAKTASVPTPSN